MTVIVSKKPKEWWRGNLIYTFKASIILHSAQTFIMCRSWKRRCQDGRFQEGESYGGHLHESECLQGKLPGLQNVVVCFKMHIFSTSLHEFVCLYCLAVWCRGEAIGAAVMWTFFQSSLTITIAIWASQNYICKKWEAQDGCCICRDLLVCASSTEHVALLKLHVKR
jgi:hypothetical protein